MKDTSFEVETLTIYYNGDESVGIFTRQYEIKGPFIFEDSEHLEEFKKKLADAFEVVEDGRPSWILSDVELKNMELPEIPESMEQAKKDFYDFLEEELQSGWTYCINPDCPNQVPPMNEVNNGVGIQVFSNSSLCQECHEKGIEIEPEKIGIGFYF